MDQKLDAVTWKAYQQLDEKYQKLLTNWNEAKSVLRSCGYKEEALTVRMLKDVFGVR